MTTNLFSFILSLSELLKEKLEHKSLIEAIPAKIWKQKDKEIPKIWNKNPTYDTALSYATS